MVLSRIDAGRLSVDEHMDYVRTSRFGAVVTFIGQVRDHDPAARSTVTGIEYTAHPDAETVLKRLCRVIAGEDFAVAASHRVGPLEVGDIALVACVAAAHRAEAYAASRELVESIKAELPVWKRQIEAGGASQWIGL